MMMIMYRRNYRKKYLKMDYLLYLFVVHFEIKVCYLMSLLHFED